jgi:hypothetical protein
MYARSDYTQSPNTQYLQHYTSAIGFFTEPSLKPWLVVTILPLQHSLPKEDFIR